MDSKQLWKLPTPTVSIQFTLASLPLVVSRSLQLFIQARHCETGPQEACFLYKTEVRKYQCSSEAGINFEFLLGEGIKMRVVRGNLLD